MSRIRVVLAYSWAFLMGPLLLAVLLGMPFFAQRLVAVTGLHVHPTLTGGAVARTIDHESYKTVIHRPVFDGLVGERKRGFVQIGWEPGDANLPGQIDEQIDFDADGTSDFRIHLDTRTNEAELQSFNRRVLAIDETIPVGNARVLRIKLRR